VFDSFTWWWAKVHHRKPDNSMQRVFKYRLEINDVVVLYLPKDAKVLTVQAQNDVPCIWAAVNPAMQELEKRTLRIAGTGHAIVDEIVGDYVGTFQLCNGKLVYHVFEVK
jgi:hypothetical protein